jgi:hypothetical protein
MQRAFLVWVSLLMLAACTSTHRLSTPAPRTAPPATMPVMRSTVTAPASPTGLGQPPCRQPSHITRGAGFPEVEGSSNDVRLWGLIMADGPDNPLRVNEQVKIVWRVTGAGELRLTSIGPDGGTHPLKWGPDAHVSSTYRRPGEEWGAGYLFTQPGCWQLHTVRGDATADVWLNIAP